MNDISLEHSMPQSSLYLVWIRNNIPVDVDGALRDELVDAELKRALELVSNGTIQSIHRVVARRENVGIWRATSPQELHDVLASLPMYPYLDITVTPLAAHPAMSPEK